MPLLPESTAAFAKEDRYGFEAIDETGRPVVVYVTREAIDETDAQAGRDPLAIIEKNRALLQWAAGAKYDAGLVETDGSVLITSSDLVPQQ